MIYIHIYNNKEAQQMYACSKYLKSKTLTYVPYTTKTMIYKIGMKFVHLKSTCISLIESLNAFSSLINSLKS